MFDTSTSRDPLQFIIGNSKIIPGFDQAVIGMNVGETKTISIPSTQEYGPHLEDKVLEVNQDQIPKHLSVTLDGNHPLAGKDLVFEIQLVDIL